MVKQSYSKIKINLYYVLFLALEVVMIYPNVLNYAPGYNLIRIAQNMIGIVSILLSIKFIKSKNIRFLLYIFLSLFVSTAINSSDFSVAWYYYSKSFGLIICLYYLLRLRPFEFLKVSADYFSIILVLNAILTVIRPDGLVYTSSINEIEKGVYFLGERNQVMPYYIIGISLCIIYYQITKMRSFRIFVVFICAWVSEAIYLSSTSMIGLSLLTIMTIIFYRKKNDNLGQEVNTIKIKRRKRLFVILALIVLIGYYLIVIVRIQNNFGDIIYSLFKKDVTFSTRTIIWDEALNMVKNSFIWGYGAISGKYISIGMYMFNAHNIVLQILLMGGLFMIVFTAINFISSLNIVAKFQNRGIRQAFIGLYIAYFVMSMTEFYPIQLLVFIMSLPFFMQHIIQTMSIN